MKGELWKADLTQPKDNDFTKCTFSGLGGSKSRGLYLYFTGDEIRCR